MKAIYNCMHGKTIFESCDQCEIIWLQKRIKIYETKLVRQRDALARLVTKINLDYSGTREM